MVSSSTSTEPNAAQSSSRAAQSGRPGAGALDVIGRVPEREVLEAALDAGAHVVLEGPPGTGKSTLLRSVARGRDVGFSFVEGNAELTPARLVGHFDPALVLSRGYDPETFVDGPLLTAMRSGTLLYIEELNRVPEETLNVLLTAMSEREVAVPRLGRVLAEPGFRFVAAMNPFDAVGTARISGALADRTCRISMGYQDADSERAIVLGSLNEESENVDPAVAQWVSRVVNLVRATREHAELRVGASVRGAIDLARVAAALAARRGTDLADVGLAAALVSLSGRVQVAPTAKRSAEAIITELYELHVGRPPQRDADDGDDAGGQEPACPQGADGPGEQADPTARPPRPRSHPDQRQVGRSELSSMPGFEEISPEVGQIDEDALREAMSEDVAGTVRMLARMRRATDPVLRSAAELLSARMLFDRMARSAQDHRGVHRRQTSTGRLDGDLDVDGSVEAIVAARAEGRVVGADELRVSHWARGTLGLVLLIDQSGSMTGDRLAHAAVLAAACALRMPDELGVLAFGRDVSTLRELHDASPGHVVVDRVLRLVGHGETGLSRALWRAGEVLAGSRASRRVVVLLSDCRASGPGEDGFDSVVAAAAALPELCIVAPEADCEQARDLASRAGARFGALSDPAEGPAVLEDVLTGR